MKTLKQFQIENKDCCKKCGSYDHTTKDCPKIKKEETEVYWSSKALDQLEALSPQDQTKLRHQKRFAQKELQINRQKMQLKKQGKLNVNHEEVELDELNRYEKETGKSSGSLNMPKGKPTQKGGTSSPVMRAVRTKIRKDTGKPEGQQKKVKGKKPPVAGEYGARRTPAQIVQKRREQKKAADAAMRDTRGT